VYDTDPTAKKAGKGKYYVRIIIAHHKAAVDCYAGRLLTSGELHDNLLIFRSLYPEANVYCKFLRGNEYPSEPSDSNQSNDERLSSSSFEPNVS